MNLRTVRMWCFLMKSNRRGENYHVVLSNLSMFLTYCKNDIRPSNRNTLWDRPFGFSSEIASKTSRWRPEANHICSFT
jgi:hypothetical protein